MQNIGFLKHFYRKLNAVHVGPELRLPKKKASTVTTRPHPPGPTVLICNPLLLKTSMMYFTFRT